jgi:hypothetical protein
VQQWVRTNEAAAVGNAVGPAALEGWLGGARHPAAGSSMAQALSSRPSCEGDVLPPRRQQQQLSYTCAQPAACHPPTHLFQQLPPARSLRSLTCMFIPAAGFPLTYTGSSARPTTPKTLTKHRKFLASCCLAFTDKCRWCWAATVEELCGSLVVGGRGSCFACEQLAAAAVGNAVGPAALEGWLGGARHPAAGSSMAQALSSRPSCEGDVLPLRRQQQQLSYTCAQPAACHPPTHLSQQLPPASSLRTLTCMFISTAGFPLTDTGSSECPTTAKTLTKHRKSLASCCLAVHR